MLLSLLFLNSEGNSENMLLFLFHGTEFRVVFSPAAGFGTEFRDFLFRGTAGIPSEITLCSVYSVFRGIIFLSEIPSPSQNSPHLLSGRTRLCLSDKTSHRLVWSWILSWLGWATRLSAGGVVFDCVPFIMMSHRFNFHSLHLCVGKH